MPEQALNKGFFLLACRLLNSPSMNTMEVETPSKADVCENQMIFFPSGLLGFEQIKNFLLITNPQEEPFSWLQVLNEPHLAFVVVPPFGLIPNYQPDIPDEDVRLLGIKNADDVLIYNIVTLGKKGRVTVNLKGPIIINKHLWRGRQVVLTNASAYDVQHPLPVSL